MDKHDDYCLSSTMGSHEWRPYLSGGYKCIYCGQAWVPVEPCVDLDEIGGKEPPVPGKDWEAVFWTVIFIVIFAAIFVPFGMAI